MIHLGEYQANYLCLWCIEDIKSDDWGAIALRAQNPMSLDEGSGVRLKDIFPQ